MKLFSRTGLTISVGVSVAALAISVAVPAFAASSPGWRRVATIHFGAAGTAPEFDAVAPLTSSLAWAVGGLGQAGAPRAYRWTGSDWKASALPAGLKESLGAISAPAANDVWAISGLGDYILHYNGSKWSVSKRFSVFGELTGVTALSSSNVWVFGNSGAFPGLGTWHYNGKTWTKATAATNLGIGSATAVSPQNMWAEGSTTVGQDSIFHYTGTWSQVKASALSGLSFSAILAKSATNIWVAANAGTKSYVVHRTTAGWRRFSVPWVVNLSDMTTDGNGGFWFAGRGPGEESWALHRSAAGRWSRTLLARGSFVPGIARIPGTASVLAVGSVNTSTGTNAIIWADGNV
ncbi:MAG TPA: hypothetical protein VGI58_07025 [Streptosporangiaceae bacterium]|jgi:hypothetical protein